MEICVKKILLFPHLLFFLVFNHAFIIYFTCIAASNAS